MDKSKLLEAHRKGVGSSEVASVIGVNPYQTAYELWEVKTGKAPRFEGNKFTRAGHKLEPIIVEYFKEDTGVEILPGYKEDVTFVHKQYPHMICTPDRVFQRGEVRGIVECKSTQKKINPEDLPLQWVAQLQYQLGIMEMEFGALAWLERGVDFGFAWVEYNPELFQAIVEEVSEFWDKVQSNTPPAPQNSRDLSRIHKGIDGGCMEATTETAKVCAKLKELKQQIKSLKAEEAALEEQIKVMMGEHTSIVHGLDTLVTWKEYSSRRINQKAFKEEQPVLAEYYSYVQTSRRLMVK